MRWECKQLGRAYILQERGIYEGLRVDTDGVAQMGCTSYFSFRRARAPKSDMNDLRYAIEVKRLNFPKTGIRALSLTTMNLLGTWRRRNSHDVDNCGLRFGRQSSHPQSYKKQAAIYFQIHRPSASFVLHTGTGSTLNYFPSSDATTTSHT